MHSYFIYALLRRWGKEYLGDQVIYYAAARLNHEDVVGEQPRRGIFHHRHNNKVATCTRKSDRSTHPPHT